MLVLANSYNMSQDSFARNEKEKAKTWGEAVESYLEAPDVTNEEVNFPAIMRHVGEVQGQTILDFGCGNGRFSKKIEAMGAGRVIGVDREQAMIDLARKDGENSKVEYHANPDNTLSFLPDGTVDKVIANLVFMMCPTKADIQQAFKEIHRVLKENGEFVFLITHPAFIQKPAIDYRNEFSGSFDYFAEEKPYKFILIDKQGKEIDENFYDYHYTLGTYINTTIQSGFDIVGVEEVVCSDPAVIKKYKIDKTFQMYPQAMIVIGRKLKGK